MDHTSARVFFAKAPEALPLYEATEKMILEIGSVEYEVKKTQVSFGSKRKFAWVWLPIRKSKERPDVYIILSIRLGHRLTSQRIAESVEPTPNRWIHHIIIEKISDLDTEVRDWLTEAYVFSERPSIVKVPSIGGRFLRWILYYMVAFPILNIMNFLIFNLKVEGRANLRGLRGTIFISNHVHFLDSGMIASAVFPRSIIPVSHTGNFRIPVAGWFVRRLGCIPIGENYSQRKAFILQSVAKLEQGHSLLIYPEGDLEQSPQSLEEFLPGAFLLAVKTDRPIVPLVITQRPAKGIRRLWSREPFYHLHIGTPMYPAANISGKVRIAELNERAHAYFQKILES